MKSLCIIVPTGNVKIFTKYLLFIHGHQWQSSHPILFFVHNLQGLNLNILYLNNCIRIQLSSTNTNFYRKAY